MSETEALSIFYDGGCRICSWEIEKYLQADVHGRLNTIDINAPGFDSTIYGLDRNSVQKYFHVLTSDGRVLSGVSAFVEIWRVLDTPLSRMGVRLSRRAPVRFALDAGYRVFVEIRPFLPRRMTGAPECDSGTCATRPARKP